MAKKPVVYIAHPETGEMYSVPEISQIIDVPKPAIYRRIAQGDSLERIWREHSCFKPEGLIQRTKKECQANLDAIPEPTKFDNLYGGK